MDGREKDAIETLHLLHRGIWVEELFGRHFKNIFSGVLSDKERQFVELKVQELDDKEIATLLKIKSFVTFLMIQYRIMRKYRHGMETRVDNLKPEFMEKYKYKEFKKRYHQRKKYDQPD